MKSAIELIQEERQRQISKGYDSDHDDKHIDSELRYAAGAYIFGSGDDVAVLCWPFSDEEFDKAFKDGDYNYNPVGYLIKAGALIVAEIERLQRLGQKNREANPSERVKEIKEGKIND